MRRLRYGTLIQQAIKAVSITEVLRTLGVDAPELPPFGSSVKIYCPYSEFHADGGAEKEARLYADGKYYCHVCLEQHDVVSLAAKAWGCAPSTAARQLLAGRAVAEEAVEGRSSSGELVVGAVAALAVWADANDVDRFDPLYRECLEVADRILEPEHVDSWLSASKALLSGRTLGSRQLEGLR